MPDITDYDKSGYDYTKYWKTRQYEDEAEKRSLLKLLPDYGDSILDVGGSFGRLMQIYAPRYNRAVILDYSEIALSQAQENANDAHFKNVETVQGDAYAMPFADNTFETVLMIRVMHHIEDIAHMIKELHRVTKPQGVLILETANKIHLKARISHWARGDLSFQRNTSPVLHDSSTAEGERGIFYNYHPSIILKELEFNGFDIVELRSVSNLRLPPSVKKHLPLKLLLSLDQLVTPIFSLWKLGPSLWFKCVKNA